MKLYKQLKRKAENGERPLKPSIQTHLNFLIEEFDVIKNLLNKKLNKKEKSKLKEKRENLKEEMEKYQFILQSHQQGGKERRGGRRQRMEEDLQDLEELGEEKKRGVEAKREKVWRKKEERGGVSSKHEKRVKEYDKKEFFGSDLGGKEEFIHLEEARSIPDEIVYHYYTPNKKGDWDHKVIDGMEAFYKGDKVVVAKYREPRKHTVVDIDEENTYKRKLQNKKQKEMFDLIDDQYVYFDGIRTVYKKALERNASSSPKRKSNQGNIIIRNIIY